MNNTTKRELNLIRIDEKRREIANDLQNGLIAEEDIINLIKKDINYGIRTVGVSMNPKKAILKNIFNCPFLLCDQEGLSEGLKKILPYFLRSRYETEKEHLKIYLEQCFIDENEYMDELETLKFFYYESSSDGKCILETGHVIFEKEQVKRR